MKAITLFIVLLISYNLTAQTDSLFLSSEVKNTIYVFDFKDSRNKLLDFVKDNNVQIISQRETRSDLNISLILNSEQYLLLDSLSDIIGFSSSKKINTTSNFKKYNEIQLELSYLLEKKESYSELLNKIDEKSENFLTIWNELKLTEEKIFNKKSDLLKLDSKENKFIVVIDLKDETTSPEYTEVSFVNMPGVEYSYLEIESPKAGLTSSIYKGYFLKYLFTRGKSFCTIGVYKTDQKSETDNLEYSELFILGFGQDFYSRHLGRGAWTFFNLYSGYTMGGMLASGKSNGKYIFYISPTIGLELFKNKYVLIDSKVNYFVPLGNNRNLRGIGYNLSANFVF